MERSFRDACVTVTGMVTLIMLWHTYLLLGPDGQSVPRRVFLLPLVIGVGAIGVAGVGTRCVKFSMVSIVAMLCIAIEYVRDAPTAAMMIAPSLAPVVTIITGLFSALSTSRIRKLLAAQMILLASAGLANDIHVSLAIAFLSHGAFIFLHEVPVRDEKSTDTPAP